MVAPLNTQLGYQKPRTSSYGLPGAARAAAPGAPSTGVTRALASIQPPAQPSYQDPYATQSTQFTAPNYPAVQPTAAPGTPSTYAPQTPQAPPSPSGYTFNLETDPILQQIHATAAKQRSEAEAGALAQQKQLAIQYGDQGYGSSIDKSTGDAAAQNPFSITRNLADQYTTTGHNLDESLNQHNLFYSGARISELAAALKDYEQQQAVAAGQFQQGLGTIGQNRVGALMGADQAEQGGYNDAYSRALAYALANPGGASGPPPPIPVGAPTQIGGPPAAAPAGLPTNYIGGGALTPHPGALGQAPAPPAANNVSGLLKMLQPRLQ